jgi:cytochrome b subunit of formate dehydrogenase
MGGRHREDGRKEGIKEVNSQEESKVTHLANDGFLAYWLNRAASCAALKTWIWMAVIDIVAIVITGLLILLRH